MGTRTGGTGSLFATDAEIGHETAVEGPYGSFTLSPEPRSQRVFIATGTGLAPFLPMFDQLHDSGELESAALLFGCRTNDEALPKKIDSPLPRTLLALSRGNQGAHELEGRVTAHLDLFAGVASDSDFYVCGTPEMVRDVTSQLSRLNPRAVFTEQF